ncbi:MAG: cyclohexa-1,5-dienecarbonyl-CoA hydratase [Deltaproteobacteria bacterium GWC2_65_14]|nr:MAG: cyclohexa-1,5-dienecarbonyl-CoA hydratase [Deltaproteobacteria bacterium GWC2_65_14]
MSDSPLKVWLEKEGRLLRLRLARPKANIVDAAMIAALREALRGHLPAAGLRAVLLDAEGSHFSFGASVQEHLPESCAAMLRELHALVRQLLTCPVPVLVAVRGQCLGGGLELAAAGSMIFAAPSAVLGQPEMKLAVFPPAASCLLPERIGQSRAEDLIYSGRTVGAGEAHRIGLVDVVAEDPEQAAVAWFDEHLAPLSASSLRLAVRAARAGFAERVSARLAEAERIYLEELMATRDAVEGLTAFLGKRPPKWEDR